MSAVAKKTSLPAASLYFCTPDNEDLFRNHLLVEHRTQGIGKILGIEFRDTYEQLFDVEYSRVGQKSFALSSVVQGFITSLQIANKKLTALESKKIGELSRLGDQIEPILNLSARCKELILAYPDVEHKAPILTDVDFQLIGAWASSTSESSIRRPEELARIIGSYQAARLASARQAELVVMNHYRLMGLSVEDISATQLMPQALNWKDFDLLIEGHPVDVKNARRAFGNPNNFSEQFVKRFKHSESEAKEVLIAATLSPYHAISSHEESDKVVFLGMLAASALRKVSDWLHKYRDLVSVDGFSERAGFLPGWVFDYGPGFYKTRSRLQAEVAHWVTSIESEEALDFALSDSLSRPVIFSAMWCAGPDRLRFPHSADVLSDIIRDGMLLCGLNRRTIFLGLLIYFLTCIRRQETPEFESLRNMLFPKQMFVGSENEFEQKYPLFLHDPCRFVWSLIDSFEVMHYHAEKLLRSMVFFRLAGPNILRAKTASGSWITLLAYCGGRYEPYNVKCGKNPLVLGINHICKRCGFLICDKCGFCSEKCKAG